MPSKIDHNRLLWYGILLLAGGLVFTATGGVLTGSEGHWLGDWQHKAFRMLCHQDPARSFHLAGRPMAVCSRCYGIYVGFAVFWLAIPLLGSSVGSVRHYLKPLLVVTVLLNVTDVVGNVLGFWENTVFPRFTLGSLMSMAAVLLLADEFVKINTKQERDVYGLDRTIQPGN